MNFHFLDPAWDELQEAIAYYESQRVGLGDEFAEEVEKTLGKILSQPDAWNKLSKTIRCCRTKRFPYGILYEIRDTGIVMVAVMHLHRKPGYWKKRLRGS